VAIWTASLDEGASWTLPPARPGTSRVLYNFGRASLSLGGTGLQPAHAAVVDPSAPVEVRAEGRGAGFLVLQGRPIDEPVVQYGPFVMNSREDIAQAFRDYQATQFGGWPWKRDDPVHARGAGRFARLPDGSELRPPSR
jgi:redox-sensitive bicupin YhaK (pirin superfamily)